MASGLRRSSQAPTSRRPGATMPRCAGLAARQVLELPPAGAPVRRVASPLLRHRARKSRLLSGYLSSWCRRRGVLGVPVETWCRSGACGTGQSDQARAPADRRWSPAGTCARRSVIAGTEFLKADIGLIGGSRQSGSRSSVSRRRSGAVSPLVRLLRGATCGIAPDKTVLLYVGVLDDIHDLGRCSKPWRRARPDD